MPDHLHHPTTHSSSPRLNQIQPPLSKYSVFRHAPCSAWASTEGLDQYHASRTHLDASRQETLQVSSITSRGNPVPPHAAVVLSNTSSPQLDPRQGWDDQIVPPRSAPIASQFTNSYALMPRVDDNALDSTWDSGRPVRLADESAWDTDDRRGREHLQPSTKTVIPLQNAQHSQTQGRQNAHQSVHSAFSSKPGSSRVSATTIDVPVFLQPFAYDPETAPPLPSRPPDTSIYEPQLSSTHYSPLQRILPSPSKLPLDLAGDPQISREETNRRRISGLPASSGDSVKRQDPSTSKRERSSSPQNPQDPSLTHYRVSQHDNSPKKSSSERSSPCVNPASLPPSHGRSTTTVASAVPADSLQSEVHRARISPDRPLHRTSTFHNHPQDDETCGPDRRPRDITSLLPQPLDSHNNSLTPQDGSTSTTDLSSTRAGLSTPGSQHTSNTSYHESVPRMQPMSRDQQAEQIDSFYWHSGRSSSGGEEEEQHERQSHTDLSARPSTGHEISIATTSTTLRPESQSKIPSLPMRSTSLTPSNIAPYGASVLGFGGPSDWEYFGDYEAEEIDDEELYTRPRAPAELPAGSRLLRDDTLAKQVDQCEIPPSETEIPTCFNPDAQDTSKGVKDAEYLAAGNEPSMSEPRLHTLQGSARLNNSWNKDDRPLSMYDQRPDMDDIIRAWSEAPFVGRDSRKSTNLQMLSNIDMSHDKFADASLASTPQDRFLGIDIILKDAPEIPKLPDSIEQLSPSYNIDSFEKAPSNDDKQHGMSGGLRPDLAQASITFDTPGVHSTDNAVSEDGSHRASWAYGAQKDESSSERGHSSDGRASYSQRDSQDRTDNHGDLPASLTGVPTTVIGKQQPHRTQEEHSPTLEMSNVRSEVAVTQELKSLGKSLEDVDKGVDMKILDNPFKEPPLVGSGVFTSFTSHTASEDAIEAPFSAQLPEEYTSRNAQSSTYDQSSGPQSNPNSPVRALLNSTGSQNAIPEVSANTAYCKESITTDIAHDKPHEHVASIASIIGQSSSPLKIKIEEDECEKAPSVLSPGDTVASDRPEVNEAPQDDPQSLQQGHLAIERDTEASEPVSSESLLYRDPYADLDPWSKASLNRFAAMLREESRAAHHRDKLNIFNVFTSRESRLRVILYGADDDLILPQDADRMNGTEVLSQQTLSNVDRALVSVESQPRSSTVRQVLHAQPTEGHITLSPNSSGNPVKQVQGGFVRQVVERANTVGLQNSLKALPALPKRRESCDDVSSSLDKNPVFSNSNEEAQQSATMIVQPSETIAKRATDTAPPSLSDASVTPEAASQSIESETNNAVNIYLPQPTWNASGKLSSQLEAVSHSPLNTSTRSKHRGEDQSEVKNYLTNRRSIFRPFASQTLETIESGSSLGHERSVELDGGLLPNLANLQSRFNLLPQAHEAVESIVKGIPSHEMQDAASDQPEFRRFVDADLGPLIMVLPQNEAIIDDAVQLQDLENVMEAIPEDFTFIHASVLSWDMAIRKQREENDKQRHERQVDSEKRIDALFNDHEIGYGDISELEAEFKRSEAARRADEDRTEYQSFVAGVFDLVWARLHYELDQLSPHYEQCSDTMDDTLAGKDMFDKSNNKTSLARTMTQFLALHQKIEIRHQKAFEAVLERDRRLKKTEISPWYTLNNIAKVKQIERQFEDAEKKAIIEYCEQRDERANRLMDVLDQNTLRGVGANQDYMEAIMKSVRRIASGRAFASVAGTNIAGVAEVQKAQKVTALLATSSEEIVRTFHLADMLLNSADYEVSVAKAKVAKADMATLSQLKEERAKEDMKLMRELEHRLALIREDSRRTNDEIIKLMLCLGLQNGRDNQTGPRAMGMHMRGGSLEADDAQIEARSHDDRGQG